MFWKKSKPLTDEQIKKDMENRQVDKYKITLHMHDETLVEYVTGWRRFNTYRNGINSYKELILLDKDITVRDVTYNTKYIVKISHEHVETRYIKKEIKSHLDSGGAFSRWEMKKLAQEDELE